MKNLSLKICLMIVALLGGGEAVFAQCSGDETYRICTDLQICRVATANGTSWDFRTKFRNALYEIKERKLNCGIVEGNSATQKVRAAFLKLPTNQRKIIQRNLQVLLYYRSTIDGLFGSKTLKSIQDYNKSYLSNRSWNSSASKVEYSKQYNLTDRDHINQILSLLADQNFTRFKATTYPAFWRNANIEDLKEAFKNINAKKSWSEDKVNGFTFLHYAARFGKPTDIKFLIEYGLDPNTQNGKGKTPLHFAANAGKFDNIKALIDAGANANASDSTGHTALHSLAGVNEPHVQKLDDLVINQTFNKSIKLLLESGADINALSDYRRTPLDFAFEESANRRKPFGIMSIIKYGANLKITDKYGLTPWQRMKNEPWFIGTEAWFLLRKASQASKDEIFIPPADNKKCKLGMPNYCSPIRLCYLATGGTENWTKNNQNHVKEAKRRGYTCGVESAPPIQPVKKCVDDVNLCSAIELCKLAVKDATVGGITQKVWQTSLDYHKFVVEANSRKLGCDVIKVNKPREKSCKTDPPFCTVSELCDRASTFFAGKRVWSTETENIYYVKEAKRNGLGCGIERQTVTPKVIPNVKPNSNRNFEKEFGLSLYGSFLHSSKVPNALFFFDRIEKNDSFEFRKALRNHDIDLIVLSSPGGSVWEGLSIAGIINDRGLNVFVPRSGLKGEGTCASACSFMFFAGTTRNSEGRLGVHQFLSNDSKKKEEIGDTEKIAQFTVSEIIGFLNEFKTPAWVYEKMFQQSEMYYFKESEMLQVETEASESLILKYKNSEKFISDLSRAFEDIVE